MEFSKLEYWVGKIPWRREQLPTPVFQLGEFHGLYSPRGCKELDLTERLLLHFRKKAASGMLPYQLISYHIIL